MSTQSITPGEKASKRAYVYPPGFKHNGLFYLFARFRRRDPIEFFTTLEKKYGCAAHYRLGPEHFVFINDVDYIREILVTQAANFRKERTQQRMKILVGEGLITSDGDFHMRQRRIAQPAFHRKRIQHYGELMVERALASRAQFRDGETRDLSLDMMDLTLSVVAKTLFDTDVTDSVRTINSEVNAIMGLYNFLVALPKAELFLGLPFPRLRRFRQARKRLDEIVYQMIDEHRTGGVDRGDLLSMLLEARDEETGEGMSDEQIRDEAMTIFLAGYETMANALTWTWYCLSQNPKAEARMHEEIDSVLKGRVPEFADLPNLKYVEMVMAETMRLYPPAWIMGRKAIDDFDLGPYHLPAGSSVFMSQYIMHRNPEYFPDPERFNPARFTTEAKANRPRFAYFPFGGGARQCIGESFAWMEGVLLLATIAQQWKFRLVPGHPVEPLALITLRPKFGMKMVIERR